LIIIRLNGTLRLPTTERWLVAPH